jgi:hypothetical protein
LDTIFILYVFFCLGACGGVSGTQTRVNTCEDTGTIIDVNECDPALEPSISQSCITDACTGTWKTSAEWGTCSGKQQHENNPTNKQTN